MEGPGLNSNKFSRTCSRRSPGVRIHTALYFILLIDRRVSRRGSRVGCISPGISHGPFYDTKRYLEFWENMLVLVMLYMSTLNHKIRLKTQARVTRLVQSFYVDSGPAVLTVPQQQ